MRPWNKRGLDKEELRRLYIDERLSLAKIGGVYGCDASVIHRNMRSCGIPTRSLSEATAKVPVSKELLTGWYHRDKLSMFEIADKLGCTHSAVVYKFQKFGIQSRGHLGLTPPLRLAKETLEHFYNKRLSLEKIARILHRSKGGVERRFKKYGLVPRGNSNRACKYKKCDFSGNLEEKAYMLGFRLGDLNVSRKTNLIQVRCSTTHRAQVNKLIRDLFSPYTTPYYWKAKRGTMEIVCLLNNSFNFLLPKKDEVPGWVMENDKLFWAFFTGYSDAEGSFTFKKPKRRGKVKTAYFTIQSQDKGVILGLANNLNNLGVECYGPLLSKKAGYVDKRGMPNNKDCWKFDVVWKRSLWILINKMGKFVRHGEKIKKIKEVRENIISRNELPYTRPISLAL